MHQGTIHGFAHDRFAGAREAFEANFALFWSGGGGSFALIDMDARTSFAYAMNKMQRGMVGDERSFRIIRAMWRAMGIGPDASR